MERFLFRSFAYSSSAVALLLFLPRAFLRAAAVSRKKRERVRERRGTYKSLLQSGERMSDWKSSTVRKSVLEAFI